MKEPTSDVSQYGLLIVWLKVTNNYLWKAANIRSVRRNVWHFYCVRFSCTTTKHQIFCLFFNGPFPASFFFIFVFSIHLSVNNVQCKFCWWLDSNRLPLVLEATAQPTGPQPLPFPIVLSRDPKYIQASFHYLC